MHEFLLYSTTKRKNKCKSCNEKKYIADILPFCIECLRENNKDVQQKILEIHLKTRKKFNLPYPAPTNEGVSCSYCYHTCFLKEKEKSFCGLREGIKEEKRDKIVIKTETSKNIGLVHYYLDPLPCNCCATYFCPAGTGKGYPKYTKKKTQERGYYNLSIFFYGCSFNCLYCQNYSHKQIKENKKVSVEELSHLFEKNAKITCICFFGGSPEPQFPFALEVAKSIRKIVKEQNRIARICWEWNGYGNKYYVDQAAKLALESGGNIKFDLKAWTPSVHKALTGVDNKQVHENFHFVAKKYFEQREDLPMLSATTLLVPGYIDDKEIEGIASFIGKINPAIPYSMLGFHPAYEMYDIGYTKKEEAERYKKIAQKYLKKVNIGNKHLLY